jgi:hypothetical protein
VSTSVLPHPAPAMTIIGPDTCSTASRCLGLRSFDFSSLFTLALIMSAIARRGQSEFVEKEGFVAQAFQPVRVKDSAKVHRDRHCSNRRRLCP